MNKRIQELAQDCAILGEKEFAGRIVGFNYEKFAELIVRECLVPLWSTECMQSDLALEEYNRNADKIKKHFGVEE